MNYLLLVPLSLSVLVPAVPMVAQPLNEFTVQLEDDRDQEIIAMFMGPNGTPHDIAVMSPGPITLDLSDLPPDNYRLVLHAPGYASQSLNLTYRDGTFVVSSGPPDGIIRLFLLRWVTMEIVWNTEASRELRGEHVESEIFSATVGSRHQVIGPDYRIIQTDADLALRRHRFTGFFGDVIPDDGERFESADMAPSNDRYQRGNTPIPLEEDKWFFLRISGHTPNTIAYAKLYVLYVDQEPLEGAEVIEPATPAWARHWLQVEDLPDRVRILLPN